MFINKKRTVSVKIDFSENCYFRTYFPLNRIFKHITLNKANEHVTLMPLSLTESVLKLRLNDSL